MLARCGMGVGAIALAKLLAEDGLLADQREGGDGVVKPAAPAAKHLIMLFMSGGPSHVDTWDPKPELNRLDGQDVPESIARQVPRIKRSGLANLMGSPFRFAPHGESGIEVSTLLPHTARCVDDLCVIRTVHHRNPVHGPAEVVSLTGTQVGDRPSLGAWLSYGLGHINEDLPAFVVMNVHTAGMQFPQAAGWGAGFLPARFQGTAVDERGVGNVQMPSLYDDRSRREQMELMAWLNQRHLENVGEHSELEARIRSYELAFRMQAAAPAAFDLSQETEVTKKLYGLDNATTAVMGRHCLLARRLVESGVRIVQLRMGGWDAHANLKPNHEQMAARSDQPVAALLTDLKRRGLLQDTLVVWGGEFGRTPTMEGSKKGRDHSPGAYTVWLAGGGVRGGQIIGRTDDVGYTPVQRPVRPSDLHATMLRALGVDQYELFYEHHGRKELVTVLGGDVVSEVFAS
jgi:hypothetical protein